MKILSILFLYKNNRKNGKIITMDYQTELNEYILTLAENGDSKSIFELGRNLEDYSMELAEICYKISGNLGYMLAFYKLDSLHD